MELRKSDDPRHFGHAVTSLRRWPLWGSVVPARRYKVFAHMLYRAGARRPRRLDDLVGRLTRGPGHMPSTQQMQMQVMHRLPAIVTGVDDNAVSLIELLRTRQIGGRRHQVSEQRLMLRKRLRLRCDVLFRDDEQVSRGLGLMSGNAMQNSSS